MSITENAAITKRDVEVAKYKSQIRLIERQAILTGWNDYLGFVVTKVLGVAALVVGSIGALDPAILPITLKNPEMVAGVGLALLTGKSIVTLASKIENALRQR